MHIWLCQLQFSFLSWCRIQQKQSFSMGGVSSDVQNDLDPQLVNKPGNKQLSRSSCSADWPGSSFRSVLNQKLWSRWFNFCLKSTNTWRNWNVCKMKETHLSANVCCGFWAISSCAMQLPFGFLICWCSQDSCPIQNIVFQVILLMKTQLLLFFFSTKMLQVWHQYLSASFSIEHLLPVSSRKFPWFVTFVMWFGCTSELGISHSQGSMQNAHLHFCADICRACGNSRFKVNHILPQKWWACSVCDGKHELHRKKRESHFLFRNRTRYHSESISCFSYQCLNFFFPFFFFSVCLTPSDSSVSSSSSSALLFFPFLPWSLISCEGKCQVKPSEHWTHKLPCVSFTASHITETKDGQKISSAHSHSQRRWTLRNMQRLSTTAPATWQKTGWVQRNSPHNCPVFSTLCCDVVWHPQRALKLECEFFFFFLTNPNYFSWSGLWIWAWFLSHSQK